MAAVAPAADQATDLLQKLSLDPKKKTHDASDVTEKPYVNGGNVPSMPIPLNDRSVTPVLQDSVDHSMWYLSTPYYYGGYDGSVNEWEDYPRYVNPDGVEMPPPGVYGDMYHHGYGYAPYGAYPSPTSPVPTMGHDGQLYGTQHYQYPAPYYQSSTPSGAPCAPNQFPSSQAEVSTSAATDQAPLPVDTAKANSNGIPNGNVNKSSVSAPPKPSHQNPLLTSNGSYNRGALPGGHPSSGYQDLRYGFDGMRSPVPWVDGPIYPDGQHRPGTSGSATLTVSHSGNSASARNYNLRPLSHPMGLNTQRPTSAMGPVAPGYLNRMYTNGRMYGQYGSSLRNGLGFGYNSYDSRMSGRWEVGVDSRYKPKGRGNGSYGYGNENLDGLSELNKGPRAGRFKNQKTLAPAITIAVKGQNLPINANNEDSNVVPHMDQYNRADFPEKYPDAKFFVIKSYSEDDIHKSIKYGVWASTPNGNKKLDACYNEAQEKADRCPIFLFFSVNTSGQFVGVAEMVGPVDFNKTVEYWQQDKWNGCFPVKWHIVKDVPNGILKHITLENNDNKPVTNSRDTQEVKLDQGLQMLQLFKDHISKTSILDDFGFYEARQKAMQEKRAKQQQFQKQVSNVKTSDVNEKNGDGQNAKPTLQKPLEVVSVLKKEVLQGGHGEGRRPGENCLVTLAADVPKAAKQVVEKHIVANGVANGC